MSCCGQRAKSPRTTQTDTTREPGKIASAETFIASAQPRYEVVVRRTDTTGKRFSTLTAAQDHAKRSGGIVRML